MSRIIIFANGNLTNPDSLQKQLRPTDRIFCADGGTYHALALEYTPHLIIGDLDSLTDETRQTMQAAGVEIRGFPANKDETDLELALNAAFEAQPAEIWLVTALGGRLDQMLANIMLLTRPAYASIPLTIVDGPDKARVLRAPVEHSIHGQPGDILSLIPLSATVTGVDFHGVGWPLEQATLSMGSTWTISNELVGTEATLRLGEGMLLLVHRSAF